MPVSYKMLFAEEEPQLPKGEPDQVAEKRATMPFREVEELIFSYRNLVKIDNLMGFESLTKLKLDCNCITKIENLSHLTNLTWLDLSFNQISKIEGLSTLQKLTDLSLLDNEIAELEGLDALSGLQCLSLGTNHLNKLDKMLYLRQFKHLELVNLAGNPLCREANYKSYLCSHIKHLKFLDYCRVKAEDVTAAMEHHQDEMLDLKEKEDLQEEEERVLIAARQEAALMQEANLQGVDSFFDDLVKDDADWAKLCQVPGLTDGWNELKDKFIFEKDNFKTLVLEKHQAKKDEYVTWLDTVKRACHTKDKQAKDQILGFEKHRKQVVRRIHDEGRSPGDEVPGTKAMLVELKDFLMTLELHTVEVLEELLSSFDRNYSELAEQVKQSIMQYFTTIRDLEATFNSSLTQLAQKLYDEKYNAEGGDDLDALSEDARHLVSDKDVLMNAIQSSHELHTSKLDVLEDTLINTEMQRANELVSKHTQWAYTRNRDRIVEIITYHERNNLELDTLLGTDDDDEDDV